MVGVLGDVLTNLLASAAWDLALNPAFEGLRARNFEPNYDRAARVAERDLKPAIRKMSRKDIATLKGFLQSPEAREVVREIYYWRAGHTQKPLATLRATLAAHWSRATDGRSALDGYQLFQALQNGAERAIDDGIRAGVLSAHEAKSAARQRELNAQFEAIQRQLRLLTGAQRPDSRQVDAFEGSLRTATAEATALITPPSFEGTRTVPIDRLYVAPNFVRRADAASSGPDDSRVIGYERLLGEIDRTVLLGNPGAGKSTFAQKLCHDLASDQARLHGELRLTPLLVTLRRWRADAASDKESVRDLLERIAVAELELDVPSGAMEYLLLSGRLLVVFDGLDELVDVGRRKTVRSSIESFARRYPATRIVVTSREVGYEHAALSPDRFATVRVVDFTPKQVEQYASHWFALDEQAREVDADQKARSFVRESASVPDLRGNPLMLALMCVVYRGRGYIPRNRPEVYDKCATMLFETWDKQREIESISPIEEHLRPALRELAHWIYSTPGLAAGAPELLLLERTTDFLDTWLFEDRNRAEHAARAFLDFCRGRAWVFTETGYDASGQPLFGFVHRTFLEFFTAEQVVGAHEAPEGLAKALIPRLARSEWDVVGQLAFQIQSKRHLGHADRLLDAVLAAARRRKRSGERRNLFSFAARLLEILVPKPSTTALVAKSVLEVLHNPATADSQQRESLLRDLMRAGPETIASVLETTRLSVFEWLRGARFEARRLAAELLLRRELLIEDEALPAGEAWRDALEGWLTEARADLVAFAERDMDVAIDCWHEGWITARQAISNHGAPWVLHRRALSIAIERCRMMAVEKCRSASVSRRRRRVAVGARRVGT